MEGLETKAVALMNYMRRDTLAFPKLGYFAGFSLFIIRRKDQRCCDGRGGGTLYFISSVPSGRIFPYVAIFRVFFVCGILYCIYSPEGSAKLRWAGGGAQRLVMRVFGPKNTGAHSARSAKTTNVKIFFYRITDLVEKT
jgi:hypothetical protein